MKGRTRLSEDAAGAGGEMTPWTILFLAANPAGTTGLGLDREFKEIQSRLREARYRDQFHLVVEPALSASDILPALLRHKPTIVHFSGHGWPGGLVLEADEGPARELGPPGNVQARYGEAGGDALGPVFAQFRQHVRLVVLNACYSEALAKHLVQHVGCVVGMGRAVPDAAAIRFAGVFYHALAEGKSVAGAHEMGKAQIGVSDLRSADIPQLLSRPSIDPERVWFVELPSPAPEDVHSPEMPGALANPYRGLEAFEPEDEHLFFGREALTKKLWQSYEMLHATPGGLRLLSILGPSGSGKSSVARAGLLPALRRQPVPGPKPSKVVLFTPGVRPIERLARALLLLLPGPAATLPAAQLIKVEGVLRHRSERGEADGLRRVASTLPEIGQTPLGA